MKTGEIFGTQGEEVGRIVRTRTPKMADGKNRDPPPKIGIGVGSRNAALQSERCTQLGFLGIFALVFDVPLPVTAPFRYA